MDFLRKHAFSVAFAALALGSVLVLFVFLMPELRLKWDLEAKIANDEAVLAAWQDANRQKELPNEAVISSHQAYKDWLTGVRRDALSYFGERDKGLEGRLMSRDDFTKIEFKAHYVDRMNLLKRRMAKYQIDRLFPAERWESGSDDLPDTENYPWLQKRLWILEDLCSVVSAVKANKVESFAVKEPDAVPGVLKVARKPLYRVVPVTLKVHLPFFKTGNLIHRFLFPSRRPRSLCTLIRGLRIEKIMSDVGAAKGKTGSDGVPLVRVTLDIQYLDFQVASPS